MTTHPMIFSAHSIPKLLDGSKTQTRGIIQRRGDGELPVDYYDGMFWFEDGDAHSIEKYKPGDTIWVKEAFYSWRCKTYMSEGMTEEPERCVYAADGGFLLNGAKWRNPRYMPRRAGRITLQITEVRVQRLQEISEEDAIAEGYTASKLRDFRYPDIGREANARLAFQAHWDSLNGRRGGGKYAWDKNPWVWAVTIGNNS